MSSECDVPGEVVIRPETPVPTHGRQTGEP